MSIPYAVRASDADRDAVVAMLKGAYTEGRLTEDEFDQRLGAALGARTHGDLYVVLDGLLAQRPTSRPVYAPRSASAARPPYARRPSYAPAPFQPYAARPAGYERAWAAVAHLLGYVTSFVGPLLIALTVGQRSGYVRRQASAATDFQISFVVANLALIFVAIVTFGFGALLYIPLWFGWAILILCAGAASALGEQWRYPMSLRLLSR